MLKVHFKFIFKLSLFTLFYYKSSKFSNYFKSLSIISSHIY